MGKKTKQTSTGLEKRYAWSSTRGKKGKASTWSKGNPVMVPRGRLVVLSAHKPKHKTKKR